MPDLRQVLILLGSHLVHCLIVQRQHLVQDLGIVTGDVGTHHSRRLHSTAGQPHHLHMGLVTDTLPCTVRFHCTPLEVSLSKPSVTSLPSRDLATL